ncbi:lysophospholipid acyltransferase family protein [Amycolatopsis sp. H20-H5]|uniref:lysophospholipid acyltransferase family protein n=1 Tax=Amycolatopsis sp. H20-H5 TaxID=3046309 RepID=UPI002DBB0461|nr:lysophospholipid acyltransferase family protein [Amycolatopsis sp. H20-H5]MEC3980886.1 lysophospholipid acyltransferase family protein [Amycolatopsis sp. H20-H5]
MARERGGIWIAIGVGILYPASLLLGRKKTLGLEHLPSSGGALIVLNHVSHLDGPLDAVTINRQGRVPRFLVKAGVWKNPVVGRILTGLGQVPVHRGTTKAADSMKAAVAALEAGRTVVVYPEGTITKDPEGWPMAARTGIARIALATGVPVIPAARWGTREILDHYHKTFRPLPRKTVTTRFGEPVDLTGYRGRPVTAALLREVTELSMDRVTGLLAEIRDERPPAARIRPEDSQE